MLKRLILLLVLVAVTYGQGILRSPFILGDSKSRARTYCISMTTSDSVLEKYDVIGADSIPYTLAFENDKLWLIEMEERAPSMDDYNAVIQHLSQYNRRKPDYSFPLLDGHSSSWVGPHSSLVVIYNINTHNLITQLIHSVRE